MILAKDARIKTKEGVDPAIIKELNRIRWLIVISATLGKSNITEKFITDYTKHLLENYNYTVELDDCGCAIISW